MMMDQQVIHGANWATHQQVGQSIYTATIKGATHATGNLGKGGSKKQNEKVNRGYGQGYNDSKSRMCWDTKRPRQEIRSG